MPKAKSRKPELKYVPSPNLPKLQTYKTEWDLENLYYKNESDPRIESDITKTINDYKKFAKKWRNSGFASNPEVLLQALNDYKQLVGDPSHTKPIRYYSFRSTLNVNDNVADKAIAVIGKRLRIASDEILFFTLELGKVTANEQKKLLKRPELAEYKYFLLQIFKGSKYDLSEAEEKIIRLKSRQASGMWCELTEKLISNSEIIWKGKKINLPEAFEITETLPSAEKPKILKLQMEKLDSFGTVAEYEFNAIITDVRTEEEIRGFKKPYSSAALAYQHDEKSIEALLTAVSDKGFALSSKFYTLKAGYLGVDKIDYSQKYDSIGETYHIPFLKAVEVCRDVFYRVNPKYGQFFDDMLTNGQIDVYPRKGKRGGAFMSSQTSHPIQVMLNHSNIMKGLETLAHEMGHAVHSFRSAPLAPLYDEYSLVAAETASTLFENLVFDAIYSQSDKEVQKVLLHNKITGDIATMQRQIAFFNCELEIHKTIHSQGAMTHEELKTCMHKHLVSYLGKSVEVLPEYGNSYVYIPHLRYGFYVYSYTFGNLMSTLMAAKYKENQNYSTVIDKFLSSGQTDTVVNIFKKVGFDTTKPDTFTKALDNHANDIKKFAKLISK